jgi:hypothetical protein
MFTFAKNTKRWQLYCCDKLILSLRRPYLRKESVDYTPVIARLKQKSTKQKAGDLL